MNLAMKAPRFLRYAAGPLALAAPAAFAATEPRHWQLNMTPGVTVTAQNAYNAHMIMFWICVVIGVIVFGAMAYAMFKFRHSKGAVPDTGFTHSTRLELLWTSIPIIILISSAIPATKMVMEQYNADHTPVPAEMTVKVTGYQWMWQYEYVGEDVSFISRLDRESDRLRQDSKTTQSQLASKKHYLRDVDRVLVLPTDTRIRFVITADDVIHSWWVPALGWKQDAVPGIVNEAWAQIEKPGIYRGQCAELCGKDHGFMPIVVKAVSKAEFAQWLAEEKAKRAPAAPAAPEAAPAAPAAEAAPEATAAAPQTAQPAAAQAG